MPVGLAVVLWIADVGPASVPPANQPFALSAAELKQTSLIMNRAPLPDAGPPPGLAPAQLRDAPQAALPDDLALLFGDPCDGGQLEMGALGGGRADAPGLIHVSLALDF